MVVLAQTVARYVILSTTGCSVFARGARKIEEMRLVMIGTGVPVVPAAKPGARAIIGGMSTSVRMVGLGLKPRA
jgi:hypothetical protein